ncbi:MAG TPA: hypothetical protein VF472_09425 [Burkholderiaceae bacterium]
MERQEDDRRIPVSAMNGAIVASLQSALTPQLLQWLRDDLLGAAARHRARLAVLDLAGLTGLDRLEYLDIVDTARMLQLMGVRTVLAGTRPGIIAGLSALGADMAALPGACDLESALAYDR